MRELTLEAAGVPAGPPPRRQLFAQQVHAQAHAIVALQALHRALDGCDSIAAVRARIDADIVARCRVIGLDPDLIGDALEAAAEDAAVQGLQRLVRAELEGIRHA